MSHPFPLDQFRDVFQITTKMKNKLQPFFAEYKALNMEWIIASLQEMHKYFFDPKLDPNIKFNVMIGIKFLFDTSSVVLVNLIEIYFLPKLLQIASFEATSDPQKRGIGYFASVGYPKETSGIEKLSYNFVRLAAEFIQAAASVKSKRLFYSEESAQGSDYHQAYTRLVGLGMKPYEKLAYYKETVPTMVAQFKKNLQDFQGSADNYINYYTELFKAYIFKGKNYTGKLEPKKVLQSGDLYVTANAIDLCAQALHSPSIRQRIHGLQLLNEFVRWGDIEAAYQINCTDLLDEILNEIAGNGSGMASLGRGRTLFPKVEGSEQLKQQFYIQFLKAMQFWSLCFPRALKIKDRDSKIKLAHDQLRMKLKMEFPDDKSLKEHKLEFDRNFQRKKNRNRNLLNELEGDDPEYVSLIPLKKPDPVPKEAPKREAPKETPKGGDYQKIKAQITEVDACCNSLTEGEASLPQKVQRMKKFKRQFDGAMQVASIENDDQFDQLVDSGTVVLTKIDKALPHLDKYAAKTITFKELVVALKSQPKSKVKIESPSKQQQKQQLPSPVKNPPPKVEMKEQMPSPQKKHEVPLAHSRPQQKVELAKPPKLQEVVVEKKVEIEKKPLEPAKPEVKPKVQQRKHEPVKVVEQIKPSHLSERSHESIQITPIKMKQQFSSFHQVSGTLPEISKQSLQKSISDHSNLRSHSQEVSILPASHVIIEQQRPPHQQNLFQHKQYQSSFKKSIQASHNHPVQEEEIQYDMSHNKPKNIDNVKASYKFKPQVQLRSPNDVLKESRGQSRKGSRIDFQQSNLTKLQKAVQDDDDLILMPEDNPLELSYHQMPGYEQQIKQNKQLSFKKCFEAEKYLLGAQKNTKLFWLQKDTKSLVKPSGQRQKSRNKDNSISVSGILSEKDKKYQDQLKYIEQQKNRKIRELQKKISNLEHEGKQMNKKIEEQDKQIMFFKADSSIANSRTNKNFYIEDQDQLFRAKVGQKNVRDRQRSFYNESVKLKEPKCLEPQGKLINSRKYAEYFTTLGDEKRKKNLLKNKELLLKDETIEFGCMSKREGEHLVITFYITPQADLQGLTYTINPVVNASLQLTVQPKNILSIRKRKQEKIYVSVKVKSVPYQLPQIQFVYNLNDRMHSHSFTIPCSFHKFIHIDPVTQKEFTSKFANNKDIIRGEEVPYSKKLLKNLYTLSQYFSNGSLMREGEVNENGEAEFGGIAEWQRQRFWIRIGVKINQFICVQAAGEQLSGAVQFYISLVTSLLMKNIQFS